MKIKTKLPPNYEEIIKHFPAVENNRNVVFTYGDTLYNPGNGIITDDLIAHEETHVLQQEMIGVKKWWEKYFADEKFRLDQELEAYRNQYSYAKINYGRPVRRRILKEIAEILSSQIYGNIIDFETAKLKIKNE